MTRGAVALVVVVVVLAGLAAAHGVAGHGHTHGHNHHHHGHSHDHDLAADHCHDTSCSEDAGAAAAKAPRALYPWTAVGLTLLSGMAATLGGVITVLIGTPSRAVLGHMLSFAAGVMLYVSYGDLVHHASEDLGDPMLAGVWLFVGMAFFGVVVCLVPEPDLADASGTPLPAPVADAAASATSSSSSLSSSSPPPTMTPNGSGVRQRRRRASSAGEDGRAGVAALTPTQTPSVASTALVDSASSASSSTSLTSSVVGGSLSTDDVHRRRKLFLTGLVAAIGISLHNFPEGLIVYMQTIHGVCGPEAADVDLWTWAGWETLTSSCLTRGIAITFAIALHNIPEGMAVASPILASTGSKWEALKWCLASSLMEPLGAILFGFFFNHLLTPALTSVLNAVVAGIMIMLCIAELMPTAAEHVSPRAAAFSNVLGQVVMFASIQVMVKNDLHLE